MDVSRETDGTLSTSPKMSHGALECDTMLQSHVLMIL